MSTQTILSEEELAPLLARKRQVQAELAANQHASQAPRQSGCSGGGCGGGGGGPSSGRPSSVPALAAGEQPNVVKAVLMALGILAVAALAWWAVIL